MLTLDQPRPRPLHHDCWKPTWRHGDLSQVTPEHRPHAFHLEMFFQDSQNNDNDKYVHIFTCSSNLKKHSDFTKVFFDFHIFLVSS